MNKYTAEQVEKYASYAAEHSQATAAMLRDYATLLRERESAKAAVTDEMVERACIASFAAQGHSFASATAENKATWRKCMRSALEAVAPKPETE